MGPLSLLHPIRWRHVVTTLHLSNDLLALCGDEVCYLVVIFIFRVADDLDRAFTNASRPDICSIVQVHNERGTLEAGYDVLSFGLFRKGRGPRSEWMGWWNLQASACPRPCHWLVCRKWFSAGFWQTWWSSIVQRYRPLPKRCPRMPSVWAKLVGSYHHHPRYQVFHKGQVHHGVGQNCWLCGSWAAFLLQNCAAASILRKPWQWLTQQGFCLHQHCI